MSNATRRKVLARGSREEFLPRPLTAKACAPVGIISNPGSGGNRRHLPAVKRLIAGRADIVHRETGGVPDIASALADFARREARLLVVNGGDGTVQAVLTALYGGSPFIEPPVLALLRGGTASMLARDVGLPGSAAAALERLLRRAPQGGTIVSRPIVEVRAPGRGPLFGMFFGAGAVCRGIVLCHNRLNRRKWRGEWMPGAVLARLLWDVLRPNGQIVAPVDCEITADGAPSARTPYLLLLISTLERLFLGLHPFWGTESGPLHFTAVRAHPRHLLPALPAALRGRQGKYLREENGYCSRNVREITLRLQGDFSLDGELFASGATPGPIVLRAAGPARFLRL